MSHPSQTPPIFAASAQDILWRLQGRQEGEAARLRLEAEELLSAFLEWPESPPIPAVRLMTINRLFSLYREVLDYVGKK